MVRYSKMYLTIDFAFGKSSGVGVYSLSFFLVPPRSSTFPSLDLLDLCMMGWLVLTRGGVVAANVELGVTSKAK